MRLTSFLRRLRPAASAEQVERWFVPAPQRLRAFHFTFTNRCNLRCVYCPQGSHEASFHADMGPAELERLVRLVRHYHATEVGIGFYGEMLLHDDWQRWAGELLDMGIRLSAVSNFSRVLKPAEIATLSRFGHLEISIDTHDLDTLKAIRRAVDGRTIVYNHQRLRAYCLARGVPEPDILWTGVLTDRIVAHLPEFVAFAASCGVKSVNFNDVAYFEDAPDCGLNVADLQGEALTAAVRSMEEAQALAARLGVALHIQSWHRVRRRLAEPAELGAGAPPMGRRRGLQGTYALAHDAEPGHGQTRLCTSPWTEAYIDPHGHIYTCCARGESMGTVGAGEDFAQLWDGEAYRAMRRSLASGVGLDDACRLCPARPIGPVAALQAAVRHL